MDALTALQTRTSSPRLVDPAPEGAALEAILKAGLRAPDHAMLRPWRFLLISGEAREKFGQLLVDALQPEGDDKRRKMLESPLRAPLLIVGVATVKEDKGIPRIEQVNSVAAALQNMSVAIYAQGFGAIWRTGQAAHDPRVKQALGLQEHDEIVGYLYVGTPTVTDRPAPEHAIEDYVQVWQG
ncbi:MAG TPA: nitroreductase family protein [Hyphomicrobiales bacterium]|nr:nitroreductase family protein [Hyphomicrobiales bacterium]